MDCVPIEKRSGYNPCPSYLVLDRSKVLYNPWLHLQKGHDLDRFLLGGINAKLRRYESLHPSRNGDINHPLLLFKVRHCNCINDSILALERKQKRRFRIIGAVNGSSGGRHNVRSVPDQNRDTESVRLQRRNYNGVQIAPSLFAIRMCVVAD